MKTSLATPREIKKANGRERKYSIIFADASHDEVKTMKHLRKNWEVTMGLFCNGVCVGSGELAPVQGKSKYVNTEAVSLRNPFRRKGHGIILYLYLILMAKKLGATRISSSEALNKYSKPMWGEKLAKLFRVVGSRECKLCHRADVKFYINLTPVSYEKIRNMLQTKT